MAARARRACNQCVPAVQTLQLVVPFILLQHPEVFMLWPGCLATTATAAIGGGHAYARVERRTKGPFRVWVS
eukprot:365296-Chlamydomonas_euryale.AAC.15